MPDTLEKGRVVERPNDKPKSTSTLKGGRVVEKPTQDEGTDDPTLMQRAGGFVRDTASAVGEGAGYAYDWMRGDVPSEDLPELSSQTFDSIARLHGFATGEESPTKDEINQDARIALGYLASSDPQQLADIAKNTLPGAKTRKDKQGNLIVQHNGKEYYVNRPGASTSDVMQISGEILSYMPAARMASIGKGLFNRLTRSAGGEAATSVARDTASSSLGSEQGIDLGRAMMAGIGGAGGEAVGPLAARALPRILRNPKYVTKKGQLTKAGKRAARTAGFDPERMDQQLKSEFGRIARDAPEEMLPAYGRVAQGRRFGIELTPAQATRDRGALALENQVMRQSDRAGGIVSNARSQQDEAVSQARRELQGRMSQPNAPRGQAQPQIADRLDMAETVQQGSASRAERKAADVSEAYSTAGQYQATLDNEGLQGLRQRIDDVLESEDAPVARGIEDSAIDALRMVDETLSNVSEGAEPTIKRLEKLRRQLNARISSSRPGSTDRRAVVKIKSAFDDHLDDMVRNQLFEGDPRALEELKKARSLRREYSDQFGDAASKDRVDRVIAHIAESDPDPKEVVNWTVGWSELGNPRDSAKVLGRLRKQFGADSREWNALREGGLETLFKTAAGDAKTPQQMKTALNRSLEKHRPVLKQLYSDDELETLRGFVDAANLTRVLPSELGNPSNSAFAMMNMLKRSGSYAQSSARIHGNFGAGMLFSTMRRMLPESATTRGARKMTQPLGKPRPTAPVVGAAGASAGAQNEQDMRDAAGAGVNIGKRQVNRLLE